MTTARQKRARNARYRAKFKKAVRKGAVDKNIPEAWMARCGFKQQKQIQEEE